MGDLRQLPMLKPRDGRRVIDMTIDEVLDSVVARVRQELGRRELVADDEAVPTKRMADILGKHPSTLQKWTSIKGCPAFRNGERPWAWPVAETKAWVREYFNG